MHVHVAALPQCHGQPSVDWASSWRWSKSNAWSLGHAELGWFTFIHQQVGDFLPRMVVESGLVLCYTDRLIQFYLFQLRNQPVDQATKDRRFLEALVTREWTRASSFKGCVPTCWMVDHWSFQHKLTKSNTLGSTKRILMQQGSARGSFAAWAQQQVRPVPPVPPVPPALVIKTIFFWWSVDWLPWPECFTFQWCCKEKLQDDH